MIQKSIIYKKYLNHLDHIDEIKKIIDDNKYKTINY